MISCIGCWTSCADSGDNLLILQGQGREPADATDPADRLPVMLMPLSVL